MHATPPTARLRGADGTRGGLAHAVRAAVADAVSLVYPVDCAGCGAADVALCDACAAALQPIATTRRVGDIPVCSGLVFDGIAARVLRALKADGRTGLARALAPALAAAAAVGGPAPPGAAPAAGGGAVVVPVPTSRAALRRRGYRVAELLAHRARLAPRRLLRTVRAPADQRGLDRADRAANVAGSMRADAVAGLPVLLVDDVVTTGATLAEAARAVRAAGGIVRGAATVASTPRHADA